MIENEIGTSSRLVTDLNIAYGGCSIYYGYKLGPCSPHMAGITLAKLGGLTTLVWCFGCLVKDRQHTFLTAVLA